MLLLAVALAAFPLASSHADDGSAERARLIAAATQDGTVTFFSQPNLAARHFIAAEWAKDYPDIKLSITAIPGAIRWSFEQHLSPRKLAVEELFTPETLSLG